MLNERYKNITPEETRKIVEKLHKQKERVGAARPNRASPHSYNKEEESDIKLFSDVLSEVKSYTDKYSSEQTEL